MIGKKLHPALMVHVRQAGQLRSRNQWSQIRTHHDRGSTESAGHDGCLKRSGGLRLRLQSALRTWDVLPDDYPRGEEQEPHNADNAARRVAFNPFQTLGNLFEEEHQND